MSLHTKALRVRVKDKHANVLSGMAYEVNQVWNAANEITRDYSWVPIPGVGYVNLQTSEFDLNKELRGIREERNLGIGAATVQSVIAQHAKSRRQFQKNKLQWRASSGLKRALGWIPFKAAGVKLVNGQIRFCGEYFMGLWDSYGLSKYELGTGSFAEDARGRWYFTATVKVEVKPGEGRLLSASTLGSRPRPPVLTAKSWSAGESPRSLQGRWPRHSERTRPNWSRRFTPGSRTNGTMRSTSSRPERSGPWGDLRRECQQQQIGKNKNGKIRPGYGMGNAQDSTGIQSEGAVSCVSRSE